MLPKPPLPPLLRLLRDRVPPHVHERLHDFSGFVWRRFREDRCFETAGVLAYATVFAIVPLMVVVFGVLAAFPMFSVWRQRLTEFLFVHFVPDAASAVAEYLYQFADNSTQLTSVGLLGLGASALFVMMSVEDTFNRIWRVRRHRPGLARFLVYWTSLTLGPLLIVASLSASHYLFSLAVQPERGDPPLLGNLARIVPLAVELSMFTLAYTIIPNRKVKLRHALIGGVLGTGLFQLAKWGFSFYLRNVPSYQQIYGTLAVVPIFLIWVYVSWVVILLGASITASLSAFRFQPWAKRIPPGYELFALLRLLGRFIEAGRSGRLLDVESLRRVESGTGDDLLLGLMESLSEAGIIQRTESEGWLLARDPVVLTLGEVCRATGVAVPLALVSLPPIDDALGRCAERAVIELRDPLLQRLDVSLADILQPPHDETR